MILHQSCGTVPPNKGMQRLGAIRRRLVPKRPQIRGIQQIPVIESLGCGELIAVTRSSLGGVNEPPVVRIPDMDFQESAEGLVHEYDSYQNSENLLRETGEESRDGARVAPNQNKHEQGSPHSNPEPEFQERNALHAAEGEYYLLEDESGAGGPQDHQGLAGEDRIEQVADANS